MNQYRKLTPEEYAAWPRREAFEFFSGMSDPFYMVTFRQDVTGLYRYVHARGLSFYYAMVWACAQAVNDVEAFHLAWLGGLIRYDRRHPSFTDLRPGSEQFHIVTVPIEEEIGDFCRRAAERSKAQDSFIDLTAESEDLIYFTCLPWLELTALTNERDLTQPGARDDSIPRIAWGKYTEENGRKILGLSVEVNHRFIDGLQIGQFAAALERRISQINDRKQEEKENGET